MSPTDDPTAGRVEPPPPPAASEYTWMPGVWGLLQHICANPAVTGYEWVPLAACGRAVIVPYPADDPVVPWTEWWHCEDCLAWAQRRR